MDNKALLDKFDSLPDEAKNQALQYLEQLYQKYHSAHLRRPTFNWRGGLKDLTDTSVDLQHKANLWR